MRYLKSILIFSGAANASVDVELSVTAFKNSASNLIPYLETVEVDDAGALAEIARFLRTREGKQWTSTQMTQLGAGSAAQRVFREFVEILNKVRSSDDFNQACIPRISQYVTNGLSENDVRFVASLIERNPRLDLIDPIDRAEVDRLVGPLRSQIEVQCENPNSNECRDAIPFCFHSNNLRSAVFFLTIDEASFMDWVGIPLSFVTQFGEHEVRAIYLDHLHQIRERYANDVVGLAGALSKFKVHARGIAHLESNPDAGNFVWFYANPEACVESFLTLIRTRSMHDYDLWVASTHPRDMRSPSFWAGLCALNAVHLDEVFDTEFSRDHRLGIWKNDRAIDYLNRHQGLPFVGLVKELQLNSLTPRRDVLLIPSLYGRAFFRERRVEDKPIEGYVPLASGFLEIEERYGTLESTLENLWNSYLKPHYEEFTAVSDSSLPSFYFFGIATQNPFTFAATFMFVDCEVLIPGSIHFRRVLYDNCPSIKAAGPSVVIPSLLSTLEKSGPSLKKAVEDLVDAIPYV